MLRKCALNNNIMPVVPLVTYPWRIVTYCYGCELSKQNNNYISKWERRESVSWPAHFFDLVLSTNIYKMETWFWYKHFLLFSLSQITNVHQKWKLPFKGFELFVHALLWLIRKLLGKLYIFFQKWNLAYLHWEVQLIRLKHDV